MTIDAALVRRLAAKSEATSLDFKREWYDWANDGTNEFVKDLMCMANALPIGAPPAHILVGVDEDPATKTGVIVGVPPGGHPDDADLHSKVVKTLNRTPQFIFEAVTVDHASVGVIEIRPGGRPFYSLRDQGNKKKLYRFQAWHRVGTMSDLAQPDDIIEWAAQDNPQERELRSIQLEAARAQITPQFVLQPGGMSSGFDYACDVWNHGDGFVRVVRVKGEWRFTDRFRREAPATGAQIRLPSVIPSIEAHTAVPSPGIIQVGNHLKIKAGMPILDLRAFLQSIGLPSTSNGSPHWAVLDLAVTCAGRGDRESTQTITLAWEGALD